ncbi:GNAT family N-acetyltransferase [Ornithinicoccus halotolerans]|uniref:GNAT family N-acetyltransferase n=1 Tax=Ornithinicoccus halotolerans TaxID=1748220 RepID=UPI001E3392C3|nr:GNAT family N-acetyltransferase [Ornithinicoccus halotolerans]
MKIRRATVTDMPHVADMKADPAISSVDAERLVGEVTAGRMRPEWSWLAESDDGDLIGRALWWGHAHRDWPITLDAIDVVGVADRAEVARKMLTEAHRAFLAGGSRAVPEYLLKLPPDWRERPAVRREVDWRVMAARSAGLTEENERLQFEWRTVTGVPAPSPGVSFRPGDDEEFLELFRRVAVDSLDVATRRSLAVLDPVDQARDDFGFYLASPGERSWWRIATDKAGEVLGFVVPSATPYARNVGYLGVLPEHRGNGLVDALLAEAVHGHTCDGADRITATTDMANAPMVASFERIGFHVTEHRLVLEPRRHMT